MTPLLSVFLLVFISFVFAQNGPKTWTASPFNAPSFPLAVKTPYVNAWDPQGNGPAAVSTNWARVGSTFFTVSHSIHDAGKGVSLFLNLSQWAGTL